MKKHVYVITLLAGLILGLAGGLTSVKFPLVLGAGLFFLTMLLLDYEKATYLVALYIIIDYGMRQFVQNPLLASYWDELLFFFCILLWMYKWFVHRKQKAYRWTPMEFPMIFFIGFTLFLLLVNSPDMRIGIDGFRAVVEYIFWFFVIVQLLKSPSGVRHLLYILIFIGSILALDGIRQYIFNVEMPANWVDKVESGVRTRAFSIIGSPNILGSLMVLLIPLSVSFVFYEKKLLKKAVFALLALTMAACLVCTSSRSAWIGFGIAVLVFIALKNRKLLIPSILGLGVAGVLVVAFIPSVAIRITHLFSPEYIASSTKGGRILRWLTGLDMLKQNLWFGVGLGQFGGAVAANNKIPGTFYMDNYYLKTAVEMGITGLAAFLVLVYNSVIWGLRSLKKLGNSRYGDIVRGAVAGMCGVLVHCAFENIFEVPMMTTYYWLIAGCVMFMGYVPNSENGEIQRPA